ncbi:MAG: rhodanese-like domain-containing protein [Candidatus Calescibacterium sp.]|nr:rhodanese-like domain-containing protein [Candidatus Calescibacterium sp.]MCX7972796.1 rhodanese-like domain-containing protein [bacterium]MDW8195870.1 rhodanese-like domain-containing protein [Candidatus Calescibacterium sp.]
MNYTALGLSIFLTFAFFLYLIFNNSEGISILYDKPRFSLLDSKTFYQLYYNERDTVIIDLRSYEDYKKSHIDGSVYFNIENLFETYLGIPRKIRKVEGLLYTLSEVGVGTYNNVGIYSNRIEDSIVFASILYILKVRGIYVIRDGFEGWKNNNLPISDKVKIVEKGYFSYRISKSSYSNSILDLKEVRERMDRYLLVAVSSSKIPYIPRSVHVKPKVGFDRYVLGSYYNSHDISKNKNILLYGNDNYEVLQVYFILRLFLDYPHVVIFNGGINEWVANSLPVSQ